MEKKPNKFQWIVFVGLIPLIFAVLLSGVVLQILGYPVIGKLEALAPNSKKASHVISKTTHIPTTQELLNQQISLVKQLKTQNNSMKSQIADEQQQIQDLKRQNQQTQVQLNNAKQISQSFADQAKLFDSMKPDQAAKLIQALPEQNALQIFSHINQTTEAAILGQMDPQVAAQYLQKMVH